MALFSSSFQLLATSAASGSSGLGAPRSAWIESRIVRIWRAGDQLSGAEGTTLDPRFERRLPSRWLDRGKLTLQDVQADSAEFVDVGMVDLGQEADLGRDHGIVICEK